jgi:hypothetical protein
VQLSVYVVVAVSGPVDSVPATGRAPLQPPLAVQDVASVDVQSSVDAPPLSSVAGLAVRDNVGAGGCVTVTDTLFDCVPPLALTQVSVKLVVAVSGAVCSLPLTPLDPLHPPLAVHDTASDDDQVSVDLAPASTESGFAARVTDGLHGGLPARSQLRACVTGWIETTTCATGVVSGSERANAWFGAEFAAMSAASAIRRAPPTVCNHPDRIIELLADSIPGSGVGAESRGPSSGRQ